MEQWAFIFLQNRCTGCGTCIMACKAWNHLRRSDAAVYPLDRIGSIPPYLAEADDARGTMQENWRQVTTREEGTCPTDIRITHLSFSCMHCTSPACVTACPKSRLIKEPLYGVVMSDPAKDCISCGLCRKACPWEAPQLCRPGNARTPMTKCDFCYGRIRQGLKPACVAACPMRALVSGPENELLAEFPGAISIMDLSGNPSRTGPHFWLIPRK